jgi:hypothetical protein
VLWVNAMNASGVNYFSGMAIESCQNSIVGWTFLSDHELTGKNAHPTRKSGLVDPVR